MELEAVYFGENYIIKSAIHKNKKLTSINEVDIEEIVLSRNKSYMNPLVNGKEVSEKYTEYGIKLKVKKKN